MNGAADDATLIANLAAIAAALVAVALAILLVIPNFAREARERAGAHAGRYQVRQFKSFYWVLGIGVIALVVAALIAVVGLFFPSHGLAIAVGVITVVGISALAIGSLGIAWLVGRIFGG